MQARTFTHTPKNILSAFKATGIYPLNPRQVLEPCLEKAKALNAEKKQALGPRTPRHGKSISIHTKRTIALVGNATPSRKLAQIMVEKLGLAAEESSAEVVVLWQELAYLRKKEKANSDSSRVQSRAVLSKALVVTTDEVVRLRNQWEEKQKITAARAIAKELKAAERTSKSADTDCAEPANLGRKLTKVRGRPKGQLPIEEPAEPGTQDPEGSECEWEELEADRCTPTNVTTQSGKKNVRKMKIYVVHDSSNSPKPGDSVRRLRSRK